MPTILVATSVGANSVNANLIAGSAFEYARGAGVMSSGITSSVASITANINVGAEVIAESFQIPLINAYPLVPDSMYFSAALRGGERIVFRVDNATAGASNVYLVAQFSFQG